MSAKDLVNSKSTANTQTSSADSTPKEKSDIKAFVIVGVAVVLFAFLIFRFRNQLKKLFSKKQAPDKKSIDKEELEKLK